MALKRTLASWGNRECISAKRAEGRRSPNGPMSRIRKQRWRGEAVKRVRRASLRRR
jgi:hypothetical protein